MVLLEPKISMSFILQKQKEGKLTLTNEFMLEFVQELQRQFVFGRQCLLTDDCFHGSSVTTDSVFSILQVR
jgi:hypothetical protein